MKYILDDYHRNIPNEMLLEDLIGVFKMVGRDTLSQQEYRKYGKFGTQTFRRRFGGWNKALEFCGIQPNVYQRSASKSARVYSNVSNVDLLADVSSVAKKLGKKSITCSEYASNGRFSKTTCLRRFKSWNDVLEKAGLEPFYKVAGKRIDNEKLFGEIERLWTLLGRQPNTSDIKKGLSLYSLNTYNRRFGSWRKALLSFVEWVDKDGKRAETSGREGKQQTAVSKKDLGVTVTPEKAIHATSRDIGLKLRFKVMQRDCFKCCLCGASPAKDQSVVLHIDHIIPWSQGGETILENLQTLCAKCNLGKSDALS